MASRNINVNYEQLRTAVRVIQEHATDFNTQFGNLNKAILELNGKWQGKDNQAFAAKITQFNEEVSKIGAILAEYIQVMSQSAADYQQTQDSVSSNASNLLNRL